MALRRFEGKYPLVAASAYIDETALVVGDVAIGEDSSVWPMCVLRGDVQQIRIGARSSIQDGSVLHVTHDSRFCPGGCALVIGDDVTVGHKVVLHACTLENTCLVGIGAVVLDGAVVRTHAMVGAGSVVPPAAVLDGGFLYLGTPARRARALSERELEFLGYTARNYVRLKDRHRASGA